MTIPDIYEITVFDPKTKQNEVLYAAGVNSAGALHKAALYCEGTGWSVTGFSKLDAARSKLIWETRKFTRRTIIGEEEFDGS